MLPAVHPETSGTQFRSWGKSFHGIWPSQPLILEKLNFTRFSFPKGSEPPSPHTNLSFELKEDAAMTLPDQKTLQLTCKLSTGNTQAKLAMGHMEHMSLLWHSPPRLRCHSSQYLQRAVSTSQAGPLWAHQASCIFSAHLQTDSGGNGLDPRHVQAPLHLEGEESPVCSCRLWRQ